MTKYHQCQAKTKSGKTCRRKALPDAPFCFQHDTIAKQNPARPAAGSQPPSKTTALKKQYNNGWEQSKSSAILPPELMWDMVRASAILVATYISFKVIRAILKR